MEGTRSGAFFIAEYSVIYTTDEHLYYGANLNNT